MRRTASIAAALWIAALGVGGWAAHATAGDKPHAICANGWHRAGWSGPHRETHEEARKDADRHREQTGHTEVTVCAGICPW